MLRIERRENCFRPWFVEASNTTYVLDKIVFYDTNNHTILGSSNSGWLENQVGRDLSHIDLPVDKLKRKTKKDLNTTEPYLISLGKDSYDRYPKGVLYIPADMFNIKFLKQEILYGNSIFNIYTGDYDILIKEKVDIIPTNLNELSHQLENLKTKITPYDINTMMINQQHVDTLLNTVKELTQLSKKIEQEWNKLNIVKNDFILKQSN